MRFLSAAPTKYQQNPTGKGLTPIRSVTLAEGIAWFDLAQRDLEGAAQTQAEESKTSEGLRPFLKCLVDFHGNPWEERIGHFWFEFKGIGTLPQKKVETRAEPTGPQSFVGFVERATCVPPVCDKPVPHVPFSADSVGFHLAALWQR